jgi:hypothetical protein
VSDNQRDFYRIQDRLLMAWRRADIKPVSVSVSAMLSLNKELEELLTAKDDPHASSSNLGGFCDKSYVDVSLSGSGMGYFSLTNAEEGSGVEVILNLESINVEITVSMVIIESRVSADAENPGFWLRGRFLEEQDKQVDAIVAHVNQRQFEQLQRRTQASTGKKVGDEEAS